MGSRTHRGLLTAIAALGGLLYGYDIGIIGTALLYLDKCVRLSEPEVGLLASAVMVGALASSLVGGGFADLLGRKKAMLASAVLFAASVVLIVTAQGFWPLFFGRTLQGLSAGMIAVVVPIFLSECVPAKNRGLGATMFQLCITLGIALSMAAGAYYQADVKQAVDAAAGDAARILAAQDQAWRNMFLSSVYPAVVFLVVALAASESPRWLFRRGRREQALTVLLKGRPREQAELELREMEEVTGAARESTASGADSLFQRRYLLPLALAVTLLGINQATGIVAVFTFPVVMLHQAGLSESAASQTGLWLALTNFGVTIFGVLLVDRLGRRRLLQVGTGVIMLALAAGVFTYWKTEAGRVDVAETLRAAVTGNTLRLPVRDIAPSAAAVVQVNVVYAYAGQEQVRHIRSDAAVPVLELKPGAKDRGDANLEIRRAKFSAAPGVVTGSVIFASLLLYIAGFAFGPGVCLWLMSAELLPTRVRSLGMGFGVLFNALVSIATTAVFLPVVGHFGYAAMWGLWLVCTAAYFLFATLLLPETKGRTLEEIEALFAQRGPP